MARRTNAQRDVYPWSVKWSTPTGDEWAPYATLREARAHLAELRAFHSGDGDVLVYSDTPWVKRGRLTITRGMPWTFEIVPQGA